MKAHTAISDTTSQTYLAGTILFAHIDYADYNGYAVKAAIGGLIWMVFKLAGDYLSNKLLEHKKNKKITETELPNNSNSDKEV